MNLSEARERTAEANAELLEKPVYLPDNVFVHGHFSAHRTAEQLGDFDEFAAMVKAADIFYPEDRAWDQVTLNRLQNVARGDYKTYQKFIAVCEKANVPFFAQLCHAIYNSWTRIEVLDIGVESPLYEASKLLMPLDDDEPRYRRREIEIPEEYGHLDMRHIVDAHLEAEHDWVLANIYRNNLWLTGIGPRTESIISGHPKLRKKSDVRVLLTMGTEHREVIVAGLQKAASSPDRVTESFGEGGPLIVDERTKIFAYGTSGKQLPYEEEYRLCLRSLFSGFLQENMYEKKYRKEWSALSPRQRKIARYAISGGLTNTDLEAMLGARPIEHPEHAEAREKLLQLVLVNIVERARAS